MLWQWFSGCSGPASKDLSTSKRLLLFLGLSLPLFLLLGGVFLWIRPFYSELLRIGAQVYYSLGQEGIRFFVQGTDILLRCRVPPSFEAFLSPEGIYSNTALLWTLVLATPAMRLKTRAVAFGCAAGGLYLTQVAFLITKVEIIFLSAQHPLAGWPVFWHFLDDFFEIAGKGFFPMAFWLLVSFPYLMGATDEPPKTPPAGVGRNAPCPCGSGKKYKRCCGASR